MGQMQSQMHPGMLLRSGSPRPSLLLQRLTNPSTSVVLLEIKATFLLYYPVIFMPGGKVNVRDCHSTHFTEAAKEPSEHNDVLLLPAWSRSEPAIWRYKNYTPICFSASEKLQCGKQLLKSKCSHSHFQMNH